MEPQEGNNITHCDSGHMYRKFYRCTAINQSELRFRPLNDKKRPFQTRRILVCDRRGYSCVFLLVPSQSSIQIRKLIINGWCHEHEKSNLHDFLARHSKKSHTCVDANHCLSKRSASVCAQTKWNSSSSYTLQRRTN
jgi:hypothetical protein